MAGRPRGSKQITKALTKAICDMIEIGTPAYHAAVANGVQPDAYREWILKARLGNEAYSAFYRAITRAKSMAVPNMLLRAHAGGKGSHSALFVLERRYAKHFGASKNEKENKPVTINVIGSRRKSQT